MAWLDFKTFWRLVSVKMFQPFGSITLHHFVSFLLFALFACGFTFYRLFYIEHKIKEPWASKWSYKYRRTTQNIKINTHIVYERENIHPRFANGKLYHGKREKWRENRDHVVLAVACVCRTHVASYTLQLPCKKKLRKLKNCDLLA